MKLRSFFISALIGLATYSGATFAESYMYKWKTADGVVQYTERPPKGGIPYTRIKVKSQRNEAEKSAAEERAKQEAEQEGNYSSWRKENCKISLQNLEILNSTAPVKIKGDDGESRLMTDEERKSALERMNKQREKFCGEDPAENAN